MLDRGRAAERVADDDMGVVEALLQEVRGGAAIGKRVGKLHAPGPRFAGQGILRLDQPGLAAVDHEVVAREAVPGVGLIGRLGGGVAGRVGNRGERPGQSGRSMDEECDFIGNLNYGQTLTLPPDCTQVSSQSLIFSQNA